MKAADQFHLGIVAADLEQTTAALSRLLGYKWGIESGGPLTVTAPSGQLSVDIRCVYSTTVPRLEVIRAVAGTLWEPVSGSGIHHVGYWSDDVAADMAELTAAGYEVEAVRPGPDGAPMFAFLTAASGFRIELLTRAAESGLARCWAPVTAEQEGTSR
ncbi:glyoxalase/bleomycin resistance protein/dioxygenase superfamily protein [Nocardia nova SH22a]|uniref:Glyoxalase/bleomycin resistance protein/dioxygenase superfamily protein n=1 Tax=Nocardia nova SH22a TaxID=1415166 RepID=W5TP70_9NOCA|nr:VOC family protein [Nocardia nova]AHH19036.1 glyoxalase/bleomycin resistance protein/dioxygenase superfamily protein [Nocardia nova SH22a]